MQKLVVFDGKVTSRTIEGDYVIGISSKKEVDGVEIRVVTGGMVGVPVDRVMLDLADSVNKVADELAYGSEGRKMELLIQFMSRLSSEAGLNDEEEA